MVSKYIKVLQLQTQQQHDGWVVEMLGEINQNLSQDKTEFQLISVVPAAEVISTVLMTSIDVVLVDLASGEGAWETLRQLLLHAPMVAIVAVGADNEAVGNDAIALGAQDFVILGQTTPQQLQQLLLRAVQRQKALRLYQQIIANCNDAIAIVDVNGNYLQQNAANQALFGYTNAQLPSLAPDAVISAETLAVIHQQLQQQGSYRGEVIGRTKSGTSLDLEISAFAVRDRAGAPICYVHIKRDITARKQAETSLRQQSQTLIELAKAAEAGNLAKTEFLATISHELRTPLNAILGLSQLLRQEISSTANSQQQQYLNSIYHSGEKLLTLINDILDLAKVEAGKAEVFLSPLPVADLCDYVTSVVENSIQTKNLEFYITVDPQADICIGDERQVKQMLFNLLSNAIKFTPAGTVSLEIVKVTQGINFIVADTGIGIASEQIPLLFQPFKQLDSRLNRQYEGTGLGLALTLKLARLHGGDVTVRSSLGNGSQFTLFLPDRPEISNINKENSAEFTNTNYTAKRIFIVESDPQSAMLLQDYLQVIGYEVERMGSAHNFLERVRNFQPHLILLDVQLHGEITALDLLNMLRQTPDLPTVIVVMCSASAESGEREQFLQAGANDYLYKPIRITQLEAILIKYLN